MFPPKKYYRDFSIVFFSVQQTCVGHITLNKKSLSLNNRVCNWRTDGDGQCLLLEAARRPYLSLQLEISLSRTLGDAPNLPFNITQQNKKEMNTTAERRWKRKKEKSKPVIRIGTAQMTKQQQMRLCNVELFSSSIAGVSTMLCVPRIFGNILERSMSQSIQCPSFCFVSL